MGLFGVRGLVLRDKDVGRTYVKETGNRKIGKAYPNGGRREAERAAKRLAKARAKQ